ncbi:MAG: cytochrome P450 [Solirubrobacteraceae bacterium]|nr:cytochrome P450 [Solirubrobacteraceae bacterium]
MATIPVSEIPLEEIDLGDMSLWEDGPPHEIFDRLRAEAPVHWSPMATWEDEPGFWSITRPEDIHAISRDWETYSSERGGMLIADHSVPLEVQNSMFIGMDPPRHDRIKAIFQRGFTPKRIGEHEEAIRQIAREKFDLLDGREEAELVAEIAQPVVARVIGSFMGTPPEDDGHWADLALRGLAVGNDELQPGGENVATVERVLMEAMELAAERRERPTDDLTSLLVHTEVDGEQLSDLEVAAGFALLVAAGMDSTKATYSNGMVALLKNPGERQKLVDDPSLIPGAVEEFLRMHPAFLNFRRTATRDVELHGQTIREGDKVIMWYPASNRDEREYACPHQLDVERNPEHQAFGAGGRHFCLGTALARLELQVLFEETLRRYPQMKLKAEPEALPSLFTNQVKAIEVKLGPRAA